MSLYVSESNRQMSLSGPCGDWRTGVDCQHTESFTHSVRLPSCPLVGTWPIGETEGFSVNNSYYFPQHFIPYGSPLDQCCSLIFLIGNKHTWERERERTRLWERGALTILLWHLCTALSQMSMLTVGSSPGRGMVKPPNCHSSLEAHGQLDYKPPATYLGDEQMLRILGRGQSRYPRSPNWFLWERGALTILLLKHFALTEQ